MSDVIVIGLSLNGAVCTRWPLGKRFDKKYVVVTLKQLPSQIVRGVMSCCGAAGLYFIPPNTTKNGPKCVELLKEKLKLHTHVDDLYVQLHSLSPINVVTDFLKKN